jgi:cobyrinic acid a,c-diamide synthase
VIQKPTCSIPRIVISGLRGGSGKTILSLCLIASLHKKGTVTAAFKKGPDYIDAGWLAKVAVSPCYNLDLFMMSHEQILQSFISHSEKSDVAVIEGNRGLYDGVDHEGTYSTAQLAKLIKSPVILVIDCTKATTTIAAMVLGCQNMDPDVSIGGVVLNRVATSRQENLIRKAIAEKCNIPVIGAIPRLKHDPFPERHMGLIPFQERIDIEKPLASVAEIGEKYLDLYGIWKLARNAEPIEITDKKSFEGNKYDRALSIGIIKDSAFQFYYQENIEALENMGAKLIDVSPLTENVLPDIDALYIGGGFPETHAISLSNNIRFKESLSMAIETGLPVYAECGGLMYLGKSLILKNRTYSMAGIFPVVFNLDKKPQAHGYTVIEVVGKNPYYPIGSTLKGHEFHYSRVTEIKVDKVNMAFKIKRGDGIIHGKDGLCYKNVLATYTHIHATGTPLWAEGIIKCASDYKKRKSGVNISLNQVL